MRSKYLSAFAAAACLGTILAGSAAAGEVLDKIKASGKIVYCSDLSVPPFIYLDPKTVQATGFDADIGIAVAKAMGLEAQYKNIGFDGLIPALQAGQCDAILSALFDKPARREVVDFVDYANVGNAVIVKADSPLSIARLVDLSGKRVAVERGSVNEQEVVEASDELVKQGKPKISVVSLPKATDAIQQLLTGLVDAFYGGTATEADYNKQNPGALKLASPQTSTFYTGIATIKKDADVHEALDAAFKKTQADGSYDAVVKKWSFESMAMKP
ncbi:polar amino acid transport system substrate-binding protein [Labrys monachus]|uniref:Polar amino acid transport system substrate-binding protein n=2 Tax=Labrys monachus TaxID=217067 RepID=A0ABU0FFH2_9HYPH|nr:polar amino acid transport system substrate-binding protein [Labrys monachus]